MIAPSAYHRIQFRSSDKEQMLFTSNRMALTGTVFLALAIPLVVFVITDLLFAGGWAPVVTAAIAACFAWLWYGLPLQRRRAERSDHGQAARE